MSDTTIPTSRQPIAQIKDGKCEWKIRAGDEKSAAPIYYTSCGTWYRVTDDGVDTCPNCGKVIHHTPPQKHKEKKGKQ